MNPTSGESSPIPRLGISRSSQPFGAHLPLIDFDEGGYSLRTLADYAEAARDLGYSALAANDHMLFGRPWLDGPTALAAILPSSDDMQLMTTVALPVIRGPLQAAKMLAAIDVLSSGRLVVGVGPGSSRSDYEAVGLDFEERWKRIDECVAALRALWTEKPYQGDFYSTQGVELKPPPATPGGPPIWIGSWGSRAGLQRTARLGDGWLASAYNTTPTDFAGARERLDGLLTQSGKDASRFPNGLSTMWTFITEDKAEARRVLEEVASMVNRSPDDLASRLLIGSAEVCARLVSDYERAGLKRLLIWPVAQAVRQLETFVRKVTPLADSQMSQNHRA